jgi:hypothetical protein
MIALSSTRRRWLGVGLTAYGLLGLAAATLVVVAALAVGPEVEATLARVDQQRDTIVATLESSASALERTADLSESAATALSSSGDAVQQAADVARRFADTLSRLASTFGSFSILGNTPFAPLAADATQLAAQLRGIALDLDALGIQLGSIARDVPALAADLQATSDQLATLAADVESIAVAESSATVLRWLLVGIVLLVAWLVIPAVIALGVGIALLRPARAAVA